MDMYVSLLLDAILYFPGGHTVLGIQKLLFKCDQYASGQVAHRRSVRSARGEAMYWPGVHLVAERQVRSPEGEYLFGPHVVVGAGVGWMVGAALGICVAVVH
jgi:hypothetical protein